MLKKLLISLLLLMAYAIPMQAQNFSFELSYQSFRPFIHFHLDYESQNYRNDYESAYLKGYMDGVIDEYYYHHRYNELVYDSRVYEAGYRDGFRDRELLISLRGYNWYQSHRFTYNDYYNPSYSVRIWLDGLSLAFLQAPAYRLPKRWKYKAHPHVIRYRKWIAGNRHHKKFNRYRSAVRIGKRHYKRDRLYERQAIKPNYRFKKHNNRGNRYTDKRFRNNRGKGAFKNNRIERSRGKVKQRKAVGKNNNSRRSRGAVKAQKRQTRNRGTVKRNRGGSKEKSNRGKKRGKRNRGGRGGN